MFFAVVAFMTGCGGDNGVNPDNGVHIYTLTTEIAPSGSGSITRDPNQVGYVAGTGTVVTLTATPNVGYIFTGWSGASKSTDLSITVTMNSNLTLTANFQSTDGGNFTDSRDGQMYRTVIIGGKRWMAENLNYVNSSWPHNNTTDSVLSGALGSWCYDNEPANCEKYGRLYTWDAAMVACPESWRVPDAKAWNELAVAVGGKRVEHTDGVYWENAGTKLKSRMGWDEIFSGRDGNGTDDFGFSALPSGRRWGGGGFWDGYFVSIGDEGYWWTATENGSDGADLRSMNSGNADV